MRVLPFRTAAEREAALPEVLAHLDADGLLAYPTETVYGFGGRISTAATARLRELKRREPARPFLLLVRHEGQAPEMQWNDAARTLARLFWPGPLTLALPAAGAALPVGITSPDGYVAVRASPHAAPLALVDALGEGITSTSANAPGEPPAQSAADVLSALAALGAEDVLVLDGGELPPSPPSTVVQCEDRRVRVLRAGAITPDALRERLQGSGIDVVE